MLKLSPVLSKPDPGAVRIHSKSHKKPPSAMILGNEASEGSETAAEHRDTEIRTENFLYNVLERDQAHDV